MKTKLTVARSGRLAVGTVEIKHPVSVVAVSESPPPTGSVETTSDDDFRESLNRRYTTPFAYDHWGLNE